MPETRIWALAMIAAAFWANLARIDSDGGSVSVGTVASSVINQGAFDLLAWFVVFELCVTIGDRTPASAAAIWQTLLVGTLCVLPTRQSVAASMVLLAAVLYRGRSGQRRYLYVAMILVALAFEIVWTSPYLDFLHVAVGRLDARVVAAAFGMAGDVLTTEGNVVRHGDDGFGIILVTQCASSFILAGTAVAFLVVAVFRGKRLGWGSLKWLAACLGASVLLSECRLIMMVRSEDDYEWWHNGPGLSIYSLLATLSAVGFSMAATRRDAPPAAIAVPPPA